MKKILIVSPHADDEILGCGGYMISEIAKGSQVYVVYGTVGGVDGKQKMEQRLREIERISSALGFEYSIMTYGKDAEMDSIKDREIISYLDGKIREIEPDEVFVNYASRHQDHKKMYECTLAAMRLKEGYMPPFFALYEYPFITGVEMPSGGYMYFDITDIIDEKVKAFETYESQIKKSPSPLNEDGIKAIASLRGIECGVKYAEMFYIQRQVIK